ncbi:leucine zipper domain-containing protein [Nitrosomonas sp. Is37]|uniref:leucine zipper domain-containing protein n=1 Tax=Nitrosomonas sp. Is37 TaxID=3080535 RepID=UPI00294B3129|nr:leucine zipper domain-containing protein [Nitrosomonas sp. Is37]MDV6345487.1 leucine zipper domain-containing protein [Nitrosomonas sp. Is37]
MNMHKHIRLTPLDRQKLWKRYQTRCWKVSQLAERFRVSRPTIYAVLKRARLKEFFPRDSANQRFKTI